MRGIAGAWRDTVRGSVALVSAAATWFSVAYAATLILKANVGRYRQGC